MDVVGTGRTTTGQRQQTWTNDRAGKLIPEGSNATAVTESLFTADMNADGTVDVVTSPRTKSVNSNRFGSFGQVALITHMITQKG